MLFDIIQSVIKTLTFDNAEITQFEDDDDDNFEHLFEIMLQWLIWIPFEEWYKHLWSLAMFLTNVEYEIVAFKSLFPEIQ